MFERISFYIGNTMIEINGYRFQLGELTTEILNLPKDIYAELRHTLEAAEEHLTTYLRSRDVAEWFAANEKMILLDQRMMRYRIFRLVKQESSILAETRLFTQQYSLFPEKDCDLTEDDLDLLSEISQYEHLKELFLSLPEKDRKILGESTGLFGCTRKSLEKTALEEMLTVDGVIKARRAAVLKLKKMVPGSELQRWRRIYHTVMYTSP